MRLGLGTVQFGLPYGVTNTAGMPSGETIGQIMAVAWERGIRQLDTAQAYGLSETRIGETVAREWQIISKIAPSAGASLTVEGLVSSVRGSLERVRQPSLYGLMMHHAADLLTEDDATRGEKTWRALETVRSAGLCGKIGVSLYHPDELEALLERFPLEIIQIPGNLYDCRFANSGLLEKARDRGVEIHLRSAFLQGVLLSPALPPFLSAWQKHHQEQREWASSIGLTPAMVSLAACFRLQAVSTVLVGCQSVSELLALTEAVAALEQPENRQKLSSLDWGMWEIADGAVINPALWPRP